MNNILVGVGILAVIAGLLKAIDMLRTRVKKQTDTINKLEKEMGDAVKSNQVRARALALDEYHVNECLRKQDALRD